MSWHIVTVAGLSALSRLTSIPPVGEQKSIRPERTDFCRPTGLTVATSRQPSLRPPFGRINDPHDSDALPGPGTALIGGSCRPYLQSLLDAAVAERWRQAKGAAPLGVRGDSVASYRIARYRLTEPGPAGNRR